MIRNELVCDFNGGYGNGNNMASFVGRTVASHSGDLASFYAANVEAADKGPQ